MKIDRRQFIQVSLAGLAAVALPMSLLPNSIIHPEYKIMAQGGILRCHDIWPGMKLFMSPEVVAQIEARKAFSLVYEYNKPISENLGDTQEYIREINLVRYLGVTTDTIEEGVEKLADIVEQASKKWDIQATLTPGIALQLAAINGPGKWMCCSYLVFDFNKGNKSYKAFEKEFNNWKWSTKEGGSPKYVGKTRDYEGKVREFQRNELVNNVFKVQKGKFKTGKTWTAQELKV